MISLDTIRLLYIDPGIYMTKSCGSINKKQKHQCIYKTLSPKKKRRKILRHSSKKRNDKVAEPLIKQGFLKHLLCLNCYIYIVGTPPPPPPLLKKGQEFPKFSSPGGVGNFLLERWGPSLKRGLV